jgi:hypothetical protein
MKKKKPSRGAPLDNTNAAKPKKEQRVPLQVRVAPDVAALLDDNVKAYKNAGHAVDAAIRNTWGKKISPRKTAGVGKLV